MVAVPRGEGRADGFASFRRRVAVMEAGSTFRGEGRSTARSGVGRSIRRCWRGNGRLIGAGGNGSGLAPLRRRQSGPTIAQGQPEHCQSPSLYIRSWD
jgi:hypothetical protein